MFKIIQNRKIWFTISGIMIATSIVAILSGGLKLGIDFTGGTLMQVKFNQDRPAAQSVEEAVDKLQYGAVRVQPIGETDMTLRLREIDNSAREIILENLNQEYGSVTEQSFESIGPTIGRGLRNRAIIAIVLVLIFIILYISFAFRKVASGAVKSWVYGFGATLALLHDITIVIGFFAIMGKFFNTEIDMLFITAILTILGFSVHDTIVVYDRIRERLKISYQRTFEEVVNESVNQTLIRSINTSLTTLLVLLALYLFGGQSIANFTLALIVGIIVGTYSSIFVASPFLIVWHNFINRKKTI
ncbi:MAG: protein translocase subunit SecF [Patescibacteria group bacterium]